MARVRMSLGKAPSASDTNKKCGLVPISTECVGWRYTRCKEGKLVKNGLSTYRAAILYIQGAFAYGDGAFASYDVRADTF